MKFVKKDNYEIEIAVLSASVKTGLSEENIMGIVALAIESCEEYKDSPLYNGKEREVLEKASQAVADTLNIPQAIVLIVLKEFADGLTEARELKGIKE